MSSVRSNAMIQAEADVRARADHHNGKEAAALRQGLAVSGGAVVNVHDVAAFILKKVGPMTAMKLQKLVYYSQAWSLVWDEAPLFPERIEAWANGPVCPALYEVHKGQFTILAWPQGDPKELSKVQRETVEQVIKSYGRLSSQELSDLTHREDPWKDARAGYPPAMRSNVEITQSAMAEYYEGLSESDNAAAI